MPPSVFSFLLLFLSLVDCPWAPDSYQLTTFICHASLAGNGDVQNREMSDFERPPGSRSTKNRSVPHLASAFGVRMTEKLRRVFDERFEHLTRGESANHIQPRVVLNTANADLSGRTRPRRLPSSRNWTACW